MSDTGCGALIGLVIVGLIGLLIWAIVVDSREMEAKRVVFMEQCVEHRPEYDCQLQWDTFAAAHAAEVNAAIAAGNAAAASANAASAAAR